MESQTGNEVWPPAPDCPPAQPGRRPPLLHDRLRVFLPPGLIRACFCGLGWLVLAHGLLWHLPPTRYYHLLLILSVLGMGRVRGKETPLQEWSWSLSILLLFVYFGFKLMHIAHYF